MEPLIESLLRIHRQYRWLAHVAFWVLIYGLGFLEPRADLTVAQRTLHLGLIAVSRISLAYFLVYWLIPRYLERGRYGFTLLGYVAGSYLLYALLMGLRTVTYPLVGWSLPDALRFPAALLNANEFVYNHLFGMLGGAAALVLVKLLLNRTEVQRKALTLEKQKAELELKLLKGQLNPHFLFNTLNNIYSLAVQQSAQTPEAIARLADMLDYMLYRSNGKTVPLSGEIDLITNYIELEKLRYDDRLRVTLEPPANAYVAVPPLLLLSLVENAFKHGASADAGSPSIDIWLQTDEGRLTFRIENSVAGHQPVSERPSSIGLPNLRQQLALLYPGTHTLDISQRENRYVVVVSMPTHPLSTAYENALSVG